MPEQQLVLLPDMRSTVPPAGLIPPKPGFELPRITIRYLRESMRTFHGLFHQNKCNGTLLEEMVYRALNMDDSLTGRVLWRSGSHNQRADIKIVTPTRELGLSIKSGTRRTDLLNSIQISGHRLSKARGDFHKINKVLRQCISDVVVCFIHNPAALCYECLYIDAAVFEYPYTPDAWTPKIGPTNGLVNEYTYTSPAGLQCILRPDLSMQIWWRIPPSLCRLGHTIPYAIAEKGGLA